MAVHSHSPYNKDKSGWSIHDPHSIRRRVWVALALLCLIFGGLVARLWFLQVVQGTQYLARAQDNRIQNVPLTAPRGLILDRNGKILATSRASHSVAVVPAALPSVKRNADERKRVLTTLGFLLHTSADKIEQAIVEARERGGRLYDPVRIAGPVELKTITLIEENKARLGPTGAVLVTDDIKRFYPGGRLASHVLGYSGIVTERDIERAKEAALGGEDVRKLAFDDIVGKSGIERQYDRVLAGVRGSEQYEVDARGRPVRRRGEQKEKPGQTLVLTIDDKLQRAAEQALDSARNSGGVAVIDPRNGEVLALASRPTFDPNIFSLTKKDFAKAWKTINDNKKHPLINRAVTSRFAPGSTFKPITAAAGLERGTLNPNWSTTCTGGYHMGRRFGCWSTHGGGINLERALAVSCNVYFYQQSLKMGNPESTGPTWLAQEARRFGLGRKTGVDLPVDAKGLVPDPAWRVDLYKQMIDNLPKPTNAKEQAKYDKKVALYRELSHWFPGNTLNMSIGQGDVLATPLQMANAIATVANGGTLYQPHLMKEVRDAATNRVLKESKPQGEVVGIKPQYLALVRKGMRAVVANGTGRSVAMPHVAVAGKTGSAEDANHVLPHAWWVCFAPYDPTGKVKPRVAIAVIIENSGHGSENAVPVAKKILEAAFPAPKKDVSTR